MNFFDLPVSTKVTRVVPKNAFDEYTNTKQKKLFADDIQRITWTNKISSETISLDAKDIKELQIFKVELKQRIEISKILEIINKAIPYHIVFWVEFDQEAYISTSSIHIHPTKLDITVIDWTFSSDWFRITDSPYQLNLKYSIDAVFKDLCIQLSGRESLSNKPMNHILRDEQRIAELNKEIGHLKNRMRKSKQFNEKVTMNIKLKALEKELKSNK